MKLNPTLFLIFGLTLAVSHSASGTQPPNAAHRLEELGTAMKGAAASTKRRVLEDFREDLDGAIVRFTGTVWTLSSIDLDRDPAEGTDKEPALFNWEYQGILLKGDAASEFSGKLPGERAIKRLGGATKATLIIIRSGKYQLYALTASPAVIDTLRQGVPITIEAQVSGLRENSFLGFVTTILGAAGEVHCPNDHQLPEDHDFRFCPYCGEALN